MGNCEHLAGKGRKQVRNYELRKKGLINHDFYFLILNWTESSTGAPSNGQEPEKR